MQKEYAISGMPGQFVPAIVSATLDSNNNPQAASNANPVPMVDAFTAPLATNWTSATGLNTAVAMNTAGMDTVAVTIQSTGTFTAGSIIFEVFDGANWVAIKCARATSYNTDSTYAMTGLTGTVIQGWTVPAAGFPQFRFRLSAVMTGTAPTALITTVVSSAPDTSIVTAGLDPTQSLHPGALQITNASPQVVAIGAASVASAAVAATTNRVTLSASAACWVAIGAAPTAVANTTGSIYVPANFPMPPIVVTPGITKIAVIQAVAGGYLSIIESN